MFGFGGLGFGYYDDGGGCHVNRSGWHDKSAAASRREEQAKKLLDAFLEQSSKLAKTAFPRTQENLVTADVHLTNPCWLSFRKYALSKGVTVKRREATLAERKDDKRKGKMYVISATLSVHPSQAVQAEEEHKVQAAESAAKRKEREAARAQEKAREEQAKRQRIANAYNCVVADLRKAAPAAAAAAAAATTTNGAATDAVDPQSILNHAEQVYQDRLKEIRASISQEKRTMEKQLDQKQKDMEKEALDFCKQVKQSVLNTMPNSKQCTLCQKNCKVLIAECKECNNQICADCLEKKVKNENRCYLCKESWLGEKRAAARDDSAIQYGKLKSTNGSGGLASFICNTCARPYDNFTYTYCCEGYVCEDHNLNHNCCVCSGGRPLCTRCGIERCSRCGAELCNACSFKEGCMCEGKSGRRIMMEQLGEYY